MSVSVLHFIEIFAAVLGLIGSWLISEKDIRGYYVWIASNIAAMITQYESGLYVMVAMFLIYTIINIRGVLNWKKSSI